MNSSPVDTQRPGGSPKYSLYDLLKAFKSHAIQLHPRHTQQGSAWELATSAGVPLLVTTVLLKLFQLHSHFVCLAPKTPHLLTPSALEAAAACRLETTPAANERSNV
jgi:hypothetical protein